MRRGNHVGLGIVRKQKGVGSGGPGGAHLGMDVAQLLEASGQVQRRQGFGTLGILDEVGDLGGGGHKGHDGVFDSKVEKKG